MGLQLFLPILSGLISFGVFLYLVVTPPMDSKIRIFIIGALLVLIGIMISSMQKFIGLSLVLLILGTLNILRSFGIIERSWIRPLLIVGSGLTTVVIFLGVYRIANSIGSYTPEPDKDNGEPIA